MMRTTPSWTVSPTATAWIPPSGPIVDTVAQVSGPQWLSFAGTAVIERDQDAVAHAVGLYAARYRQPGENPQRVVIRLTPETVLGSA
ncbi:hypothetical protein ACC691_39775, partial [Rhizobium johnstonii]